MVFFQKLRHFFISGLRSFWRNKSSNLLNILGLDNNILASPETVQY
jgi:hypothetical protein